MKKYLPVLSFFVALIVAILLPSNSFAQTSGADLVVSNLQLTDAQGNIKTSFQPNELIYYRITIANQGTQRTADRFDNQIYHTYYRNSPQAITSCAIPSDPRNFYSYSTTNFPANSSFVYESRPGGIKEAQFPGVKSFTQTTPGTYTARAYVDYDCRAIEANDSNNQRTVSYTILGQVVPTATPTQAPVLAPTATPTQVPAAGVAQPPSSINPAAAPVTALALNTASPQEGAWIIDSEVTKIGKNASRSGMLLDWALRDYQWAFVREGDTNPLIPFWLIIQRIVYALFLFVILVTSFILIITRGKSLSAKRFLPRFLLVILLVTFSFSLVQLLYQVTDIFQGFFLRNPQGGIISSRDLLYIGWDYRDFQGLRRFGEEFEESALMSLLFVKLTAFTYYAMAILLVVRKIILWFFIILSPVFPLLLLFYPVRNTAKIWIGEFFRWLLYAPLFAIFLSGLVRLWQTSLPLAFNFSSAGREGEIVYPTVVGILLGGPRQNVSILNSLNVPDTFALYLVALIMLWVCVILPFILLQIFLDYMYAANFKESPIVKQMMGRINNRFALNPPPLIPGIPPTQPAGLARSLPISKRFSVPTMANLAKPLPTSTGQTMQIPRPISTNINRSTEIAKLANVSIPNMRDIARFDTTRLSRDTRNRQEIQRMQHVLERIANPASVMSMAERERAREVREKLVTESQKGNQVATTLLQAAQTMSSQSDTSVTTSTTQSLQTLVQQLASPQQIFSVIEREKITSLKERLIKEVQSGSQVASSILTAVNNVTANSVSSFQESMSKIANPQSITENSEKQVYQNLREKIITASKSGNDLATLVVASLESSTTSEQIKVLQEKLLHAQAEGSPLAQEILKTVQNTTNNNTNIKNSFSTFQKAFQKLTSPQNTQSQVERQTFKELREKLITASNSGNNLATMLVSSLEQTTSAEQVKVIQDKLLQAQVEGNPLAQEILTTLEKSSENDKAQQLENLQQKLTEAKKQGDPLATVLLTMLSQHKSTKSTAPIKAQSGIKQVGFPVVNRLQQVSLDDYEAVKKLWKENYQSLDVPQSLSGARNRREWITEDLADIESTINLLTSQNPTEVEEGMQKVSDILPFLLIGGFSQTEIIAYLKAKMEAGKGVLEDVSKSEAEEDTLVTANRSNTSNQKHQYMSATTEVDNSDNSSTSVTNNTTISAPVTKTEIHTVSPTSSSSPRLLQLVNLSLPTMRDIASYEKNKMSHSDSSSFPTILNQIAHPEKIQNEQEQERIRTIKEELQKQSKTGDQMATAILSAATMIEGEKTELSSDERENLVSIIQGGLSQVSVDEEDREAYSTLHQALTTTEDKKSPLVQTIQSLVGRVTQEQTEQVQQFLRNIASPESIHTAVERTQYTKLRERLGEASDTRNILAQTIINTAKADVTSDEARNITAQLQEAQKANDPLATYILTTLITPTEITIQQVQNVYKQVVDAKKKGDPLAALLLGLFVKKQRRTGHLPSPVMLPKQNRLQQVSLDDYEAVKKMWYENYLKAPVPLSRNGKTQTREEWIEEDRVSIEETMGLLSSGDAEQEKEGMEQVADILPFLLIGGFSQSEVVGYLKAKLEAGKMALATLSESGKEEELVAVKKNEPENKVQEAVVEEERKLS